MAYHSQILPSQKVWVPDIRRSALSCAFGPRTLGWLGSRWWGSGWRINFRAVAKSVAARGAATGLRPLGIWGGGRAAWVDDTTPMREALSDKGKAYGALGVGFVVALGTSSFSHDDWDVMNALYGSDQVEISRSSTGAESVRSVRAPDGYWYGGSEWRHKNVSAVLVAKHNYPAFVANQLHTLWEHPEPDHPVTGPSVWRRAVPGPSGVGFVDPSITQGELFGFPPGWPLGEPFPDE